ncbi:YtxH domain-containing protein [Flavobacterium ardleyense]|uniref:YtxH domain-containing protein n=1 Tax=Flavobacterium ardleyense TaxID=2038737 RepID=A0ABW5Z3U8_9FLAO
MKSSNVLLGVVGGLAAGAVLGVLFAPDKGENTRKKIAQKSSDLKDNLTDSFSDFVSNVEDKYKDLASKASSLMEDGSENLEKINKKLNV